MSDDDELFRASMRSIFSAGDYGNDSDSDDEHIGEYVWHCPAAEDETVRSIIYHLALLAPGHGNSLWNACICIAEHLSSMSKRSKMLGDDISRRMPWPPRTSLEFGAGAALPSMILLREGTSRVIITDRKVNDMTFEALERSATKNAEQWNVPNTTLILPHTWGEQVHELVVDTSGEGIDVLVASDCIYNPDYHNALLQSASATICSELGIFIVGYSYHSNVTSQRVEEFFAKAEEYDFRLISEFKKNYKEQEGIGSKDPERAVVHCKVLANKDSIYCRE